MTGAVVLDEPLERTGEVLAEHGFPILCVSIALALAGLLVAPAAAEVALLAASASLAALVTLGQGLSILRLRDRRRRHVLGLLIERDPAPSILSDADGTALRVNPAARRRFGAGDEGALVEALGRLFANPAGTVHRLQEAAAAIGAASEDLAVPGGVIRLAVVRQGRRSFLWRFEEMRETRSSSAAHGGGLPRLTVGPTGAILALNDPMRGLLGDRAPRHLDRVLSDLPLRAGGVHLVSTDAGAVPHRVAVVTAEDGVSDVYLLPPEFGAEPKGDEAPGGLEDLPVGLVRLGHDGTIAEANRLARALLSREDGDELAGAPLPELLEGLGRPIRDWLEDAMHGRGLGRPEVLRVCAEGVERYLQVTLGRAAAPGQAGLVAVLNDATELKTLEAQFVQSQKMQAIGQLAGGVAHDFNNLLTAISGHCDLMLLRHDAGDPDYGDLVQIHQNANRAASLVGQLLAFSRKQTLQPQVIDLRDALSELTHLLNRLVGEKVRLSFSHEYGLPPIRADKRQLEQVIMNLVVNARDAMPSGGEIRVETSTRLLREDLSRDRATVPVGRYVVVKVEDQGTGIAPDKLGKIFEPFFTTKRTGEGTGLGLSTVYGIVKQSGGYIFVDSVPHVGTVFTLYFPAYDGPADPPAPMPQPHPAQRTPLPGQPALPPAAGRLRPPGDAPVEGAEVSPESSAARPARAAQPQGSGVILLVEDEAPVRAFASRALRMRGYTVIEAENAEQALETLEDAELAIDLFVTDVIMPGIDGPTWVRRALQARPNVKVVFVSGYAEDSFAEEKMRIPNSVFLPKPFSLSELTATVHDQLN